MIHINLASLGQHIRSQRQLLGVSATMTAQSAGLSRVTLHRIEKGEPAVSMGAYCSVLDALGDMASMSEFEKNLLAALKLGLAQLVVVHTMNIALPNFQRPQHQGIARVLAALDVDVLRSDVIDLSMMNLRLPQLRQAQTKAN